MKSPLLSLLVAFTFALPGLRAQDSGPLRETVNFNREWRFQLGDPADAEAVGYDDAAWDSIGLSHSFSMPYFAAGNSFYVGYGWYRKRFDLPARLEGKRLYLDCRQENRPHLPRLHLPGATHRGPVCDRTRARRRLALRKKNDVPN